MNKLDLDQEELPVRSMLDLLLEMGEERAMAKGREKWERNGMGNLLLGMLESRFGPLSEAVAERIRAADTETLQRWSLRLMTATAIDDVLAD